MQIIRKNLREGKVKLKIHTLDDIWHLQKILEPGDLVTAVTRRKVALKRGQEIEEGDRKPMLLTLEVEKFDFHKDTGSLRITGPIKSGPEEVQLSSYHTVSIRPGSELEIRKKEWKRHMLQRMEQARTKKAMIFICMVDRDQANFAELRESGVEMLGTVKAGEYSDDESRDSYYQEILDYIKKKKFQHIVVAGPGFERENLYDYIKEKDRDMVGKITLQRAYSVGKSGVNEVIKSSANKIVRESRVSRETEYVEELFRRIKTDGLAAYGPEETKRAVDMGAAETLLVSDEKTKEYREMMDNAEKMGGNVVVVSSDHEAGEGFLHLGGIAALLRFRF